MKKFLAVMLVMIMVISFVGCYEKKYEYEKTDILDDFSKKTLNFDLSQYKEHGEISDGLVWVIKETSNSDADSCESYAYLDCEGNVIYGWHSVGIYYNNGLHDCRATIPQDFKNGYALIYDQSKFDELGGYVEAIIINKNGKEIAKFLIDAYRDDKGICIDYVDFNSQGYAFFFGKENHNGAEGMFFINDSGIHMFEKIGFYTKHTYTLRCIELVSDKYLYVTWPSCQLFDLNGNLVTNISVSTGIYPDHIEIVNDTYIEAQFTDKDKETYICVIDFNGFFIKPPILKSEYVRNVEEWEEIDAVSILGCWYIEPSSHREDTLEISEKNLIWITVFPNGQLEKTIMYYNDTEFYRDSIKIPYRYEDGKLIVTLLDGSQAAFTKG